MKRRIVSIVIAAMTLILCAVPATAEPGSSEALYSDGLVTSESAVYSLVGSDRIAVNVPAKMTAAEMKSQLVSSRGVDVIAPDGESVLADDSFVPAGSTLQLTEVGIVTREDLCNGRREPRRRHKYKGYRAFHTQKCRLGRGRIL